MSEANEQRLAIYLYLFFDFYIYINLYLFNFYIHLYHYSHNVSWILQEWFVNFVSMLIYIYIDYNFTLHGALIFGTITLSQCWFTSTLTTILMQAEP